MGNIVSMTWAPVAIYQLKNGQSFSWSYSKISIFERLKKHELT
jgi:hypothetical protein